MSGQLTTSGVVNWDAVLSRSVNLVIGVLARLDKAGISPFTIEVGRILCRNIPLEVSAQFRITHAIFVLTRYGSYGNAMWFGFGIKQVVRDLAESEEGMALVALCSALGTIYEPFFSAQVLREFCKLSGAPRDITPALRQWKMLVDLCAGILSSGGFMDKVNGFNRLIFGHSVDNRSPKCEPTTYGDLAKAITVIAEVVQRKKANASFLGGLDCAWLAALSGWILCLDVSIVDSNGTVFYRSRMIIRDLPQVTILIPERPSKSLLSSKTSIVSSGKWRTSWQVLEPSERGDLHRRSSRSRVLRDTFGSSIDALSEVKTAQWFALYMESFSMLQRPDPRLFDRSSRSRDDGYTSVTGMSWALDISRINFPMEPLLWAQENSKLRQFRRFSSQYLPELTNCLQAARPVVSQDEAESSALRALEGIDTTWPYSSGQYGTGVISEIDHPQIRVKTMIQVITLFLWIMFVTDVEDDVCPSVNGLANVYAWYLKHLATASKSKDGYLLSLGGGLMDIGEIGWLDLVFPCFSGLSDKTHADTIRLATDGMLARAGVGICVYYRALENPEIPPGSFVKLHVVRGYIIYEGSKFDGIRDIPINFQGQEDKFLSEALPDHSTDFTLDMMIQELDLAAQLAASFHVHYQGIDGTSHGIWLRLGGIYRIMQRTLIPRRCHGNCDPLYALETFAGAETSWRDSSTDTPIINKEQIVEVQEAVASLRDTSTFWMLTRKKSQETEELGSWVPLRDLGDDALRGWRVSHEVVVELIVPDGSKLEITCEEPAQCKQQRKEREKKAAQWWSSESTDQESYDIADQHSYEGDESGAE